MEKSVGEKLKECRLNQGLSQQELAEQLNVTRQAVSNWERNKTLPDVYLLREIAAVFDMTLDEYMEDTRKAEITMPKMPARFLAASIAVILIYLLVGGITGQLSVESVMVMVIIAVFCQGFVHLYLSNSVKSEDFNMLAGYDGKVEYRAEEVKKVLIQMDTHVSCSSFATVMLLALCAFLEGRQWETAVICLVLAYSLDFSLALCFYNYRSLHKTMVKEKDQKAARAGYLSVFWYLGWIFMFIGALVVKFELKQIENNSAEALGNLGWIVLFVLLTTAELFFEQYRVKKETAAEREYRPGKIFWIATALAAVLMGWMLSA